MNMLSKYDDTDENNKFVRSTNALYYSSYRDAKETIEYKINWFWFFKKTRKISVNKMKLIYMLRCSDIVEQIKSICSWDFDFLRDFGTFVKITEKVYGYKNDESAIVICDSKLSDKSRTLVFKFFAGHITVRVYYKDEHEIIDINISKDTGRKMCYGYSTIDGNVVGQEDFNNSDWAAMDAILDFVKDMIKTFYIYICNAIIARNVSSIFMDRLPLSSDYFAMDKDIDYSNEGADDIDLKYIKANYLFMIN